MVLSIHHQTDEKKKEIYRQIYDLLTPGGMFIQIEHVKSATQWVEHVHDSYFIDSLYEYQKESGKSKDDIAKNYYKRADKEANILALVDTQCNWLRDIGYRDVDCYYKIFEMAVFGGRK